MYVYVAPTAIPWQWKQTKNLRSRRILTLETTASHRTLPFSVLAEWCRDNHSMEWKSKSWFASPWQLMLSLATVLWVPTVSFLRQLAAQLMKRWLILRLLNLLLSTQTWLTGRRVSISSLLHCECRSGVNPNHQHVTPCCKYRVLPY